MEHTTAGLMDNANKTRLRLIRQAVDDNLRSTRSARARRSVRPERPLSLWLLGALAGAILLYLSVPSQVASRGLATARDAAPVTPAVLGAAPPPVAAAVAVPGPVSALEPAPLPAPEPELPRVAPRRLDRGVLALAVRRIVLDPGHGGKHHGAISASGVSEKDITLDIALRLRRLLEAEFFDVIMTRQTDETVSLRQRVNLANTVEADLFLSIHVNWVPDKRLRPLETYHVGPTDDPAILRLAKVENEESGYSLADYRRLLERVYLDSRRDESRRLAAKTNAQLYRALTAIQPGIQNRGVKTAPFVVLIGTEMPAILVEVSSLSNADDVELLMSADYREEIATALLRGIQAYATRADDRSRKGGR